MLQVRDDLRRDRDGVDRRVRQRRVPAVAGDGEREEVRGRHRGAGPRGELPDRQRRPQVAADDEVHAVQRAGSHELDRAAGRALLGWLEEEPQLAVQLAGA